MHPVGWVKLHRKLKSWEWYHDTNCVRVWIHLLLSVNFETSRFEGQEVPPGSVVTGYPALAKECGLSVQQVRTVFSKLKSTGEITVNTYPKFSIVSIDKWNEFQDDNRQVNSEATGLQQASNRPPTTSKEYNNEIKEEGNHNTCASAPTVQDDIQTAFDEWCQLSKQFSLPVPRAITKTRKTALASRLREEGLDGWRAMMEKVAASKFLTGQNQNGWRVDLDFVLKPQNLTKIMEGKYDVLPGNGYGYTNGNQHPLAQAFDDLQSDIRHAEDRGHPFPSERTQAGHDGQPTIELEAARRRDDQRANTDSNQGNRDGENPLRLFQTT
jgi:hypothetical protein